MRVIVSSKAKAMKLAIMHQHLQATNTYLFGLNVLMSSPKQTYLLAWHLVLSLIDRIKQKLWQVATCTEELHLLANLHGRNWGRHGNQKEEIWRFGMLQLGPAERHRIQRVVRDACDHESELSGMLVISPISTAKTAKICEGIQNVSLMDWIVSNLTIVGISSPMNPNQSVCSEFDNYKKVHQAWWRNALERASSRYVVAFSEICIWPSNSVAHAEHKLLSGLLKFYTFAASNWWVTKQKGKSSSWSQLSTHGTSNQIVAMLGFLFVIAKPILAVSLVCACASVSTFEFVFVC